MFAPISSSAPSYTNYFGKPMVLIILSKALKASRQASESKASQASHFFPIG
jgi:hypothetical protein